MIPQFLSYWLNSPFAQGLISIINAGVTRQGLNYSHIRSFPVPFTTLQNQKYVIKEIEHFFSIVSKVETILDKSIKQVDRLRQGILKKAFEGELVPQDQNDECAEVLLEKIRQLRLGSKNEVDAKQMKLV